MSVTRTAVLRLLLGVDGARMPNKAICSASNTLVRDLAVREWPVVVAVDAVESTDAVASETEASDVPAKSWITVCGAMITDARLSWLHASAVLRAGFAVLGISIATITNARSPPAFRTCGARITGRLDAIDTHSRCSHSYHLQIRTMVHNGALAVKSIV